MSWDEHYDDEGGAYYVHSVTGEARWGYPEEELVGPKKTVPSKKKKFVVEDDDDEGERMEVANWEEIADGTGGFYYLNETTGETRWEVPGGEKNAPLKPSPEVEVQEAPALPVEPETSEYLEEPSETRAQLEAEAYVPRKHSDPEFALLRTMLAVKFTAKAIEKAKLVSFRELEQRWYREAKRTKLEKRQQKAKAGQPQEGDPGYEAFMKKQEKVQSKKL